MKLVHGGDTVGYREKYGRDALDFSANVSPLGTPEAVARAIGAAAYRAERYPDPLCRELCAALVSALGPISPKLFGQNVVDKTLLVKFFSEHSVLNLVNKLMS